MTERVEFGTKDLADQYREKYTEYLCEEDDRRLKTVAFSSDVPEGVLERARLEAQEGRAEAEKQSVTASLTPGERERISELGGFDQSTSIFNWRSAKGVFAREGLVDQFDDAMGALTDYDDPAEGAEDWITSAKKADAREGTKSVSGGARDEGVQEAQEQEKIAEQSRQAQANQCDHAEGHCRHGDPEACEFLTEVCGYEEDEVDRMLAGPDEVDVDESGEITGKAAGALKRAWQGYKGGISQLDEELEGLRESWDEAQAAARAINEIRAAHGQERMHFERLEELQAELVEWANQAGRDCEECHVGLDRDVDLEDVSDRGYTERIESGGGRRADRAERMLERQATDTPTLADRGRQEDVLEEASGPASAPHLDGPDVDPESGRVRWSYEPPTSEGRMDLGDEVLLLVTSPDGTTGWEFRVGFMDLLEAHPISQAPTREEALAEANRWVELDEAELQERLYDLVEDEPENPAPDVPTPGAWSEIQGAHSARRNTDSALIYHPAGYIVEIYQEAPGEWLAEYVSPEGERKLATTEPRQTPEAAARHAGGLVESLIHERRRRADRAEDLLERQAGQIHLTDVYDDTRPIDTESGTAEAPRQVDGWEFEPPLNMAGIAAWSFGGGLESGHRVEVVEDSPGSYYVDHRRRDGENVTVIRDAPDAQAAIDTATGYMRGKNPVAQSEGAV